MDIMEEAGKPYYVHLAPPTPLTPEQMARMEWWSKVKGL